jgi:hypothetical protein
MGIGRGRAATGPRTGGSMAFDPHQEDYQRLGLRYAHTLPSSDPFQTTRALAGFGKRFSQNRDSLPQSDGDRAFHLVVQATDIIDYQLPFIAEGAGGPLIGKVASLLSEALALDPDCHDAVRMKAAIELDSFEGYYRFLKDGADNVHSSCKLALASDTGEDARLGNDLAMRPYVRWMASLAARALVCGRYLVCVDTCLHLLDENPSDQADVRRTAALAYAKLEDEAGLDELSSRFGISLDGSLRMDAWFLLARLALAHKAHDMDAAHSLLEHCLSGYPHAAATLTRQDELPDGVFSRIMVMPRSEDELILALSEAEIILEEGRDLSDLGTLGSWIAEDPSVVAAYRSEDPTMAVAPATPRGRD